MVVICLNMRSFCYSQRCFVHKQIADFIKTNPETTMGPNPRVKRAQSRDRPHFFAIVSYARVFSCAARRGGPGPKSAVILFVVLAFPLFQGALEHILNAPFEKLPPTEITSWEFKGESKSMNIGMAEEYVIEVQYPEQKNYRGEMTAEKSERFPPQDSLSSVACLTRM